jgi:UDP-N-acetylmuramyl pentapeptide phosphotransferase/UDP-N-acetylglucosamine-1-phosphate transferase
MQPETLIAPFIGFLVSVLVCAVLSRYRGRWALLDIPNDRSLHAVATPRSGGLGIIAGLLAGYAVAAGVLSLPGQGWALMALLLTAGISFADDIWQLPPLLRFLVHLAVAVSLVFPAGYGLMALALPGMSWHAPAWLLEAFSVLFIMWMVNLYNFMDGMDGFAGGMACIGFGTLALLGALAGAPVYALSASLVCMAAAGFLPFNFPPARIFMGDLGSGSLGFLMALFLLWAERAGLFPLWLGCVVFTPFIVDATWTVVRRTLQGRRPWQAHREHFYQRLVRLGWGHRRTVLWSYALMLKCSLIAVLCFCFTAIGAQGIMLGLLTVVYIALITGIKAMERRHSSR